MRGNNLSAWCCRAEEPTPSIGGVVHSCLPQVGYYKMAELTASEYTPDGWFKSGDRLTSRRAVNGVSSQAWAVNRSGDIGLLTPGGALKIVDRKKNLARPRRRGEARGLSARSVTAACW